MKRRILGVISVLLMVLFLVGIGGIYGPIVAVEARYQALSWLQERGIEDIRSLVIPNFRLAVRPEDGVNEFGIEIPSLFIREPVIADVDPFDEREYMAALENGIAHASGTGLPRENKLGYYFAHSSAGIDGFNRYNAVFYLIHKLEEGDKVYIWQDGERIDFEVSESEIVEPADVSLLTQVIPEEKIVLQTCWPPGIDSKRLLVTAERV